MRLRQPPVRHAAPTSNISLLPKLHLPPASKDLPINFADAEKPKFEWGDRTRWKTDDPTTDSGTVIGKFYSFAPHCRRWQWCYLIWLDADSPSAAWIKADIAWEDDLEVWEGKKTV